MRNSASTNQVYSSSQVKNESGNDINNLISGSEIIILNSQNIFINNLGPTKLSKP